MVIGSQHNDSRASDDEQGIDKPCWENKHLATLVQHVGKHGNHHIDNSHSHEQQKGITIGCRDNDDIIDHLEALCSHRQFALRPSGAIQRFGQLGV
mmetsp:Transcript_49105/g.128188  ORF Transcript_49105/g.128188 Transcript_49105/m.128188 type:complete len:96 (-) Transcript_49105:730-1017(-)